MNLTIFQKLFLVITVQSLLIFGIASNHLSYKSWTDFPKKDLYTSKDAQESVLEEVASDIVKD